MLFRSVVRTPRIDIRNRALRSDICGGQYRPFTQRATSSEATRTSREGRKDGQRPLRSSIRPFTVLFLCIPIGYGINWALKQHNAAGQVSADGFVKYVLASKEAVSSTCSIFSLIPSTPDVALDTTSPDLARSITSVLFKQPQLQIARSYTLLPQVEGQDDDELRFLIKREQKGEVSGYLHRLPLDAEVEVRGVSAEYVVPEDVKRVVFLAGGTGIAPAMQIADILKSEADVHVLWANRKREDCQGGLSNTPSHASSWLWRSLSWMWSDTSAIVGVVQPSEGQERSHQIVHELNQTKHGINVSDRKLLVDYFVDEEGTFIKPNDVSRFLHDPEQGRKLLVVSGPEGFINYWAGPKQWLNGHEVQGPVAGILGGMNTTGWEIVKL